MLRKLVGSNLENRFVFVTCLLVTVALSAILVIVATDVTEVAFRDLGERTTASLLGYGPLLEGRERLFCDGVLRRMLRLTRGTGAYVFVWLGDGTVLGIDGPLGVTAEAQLVSEAAPRELTVEGNPCLAWSVPLTLAGGERGRLVMAHALERVRQRSSFLLRKLVLVALPLVIASYFLARSLAGRVLGPARRFMVAMERVARGEYPHETFSGELVEMGQWTDTFNAMVEQLREKHTMEKLLFEQEKMASVGHLAASVAHEIRNPLASISSLTQLIGERHGDDPKLQEYTGVILTEVDRLNAAIQQLLTFAKPVPTRFQPCRLGEILDGVLLLLGFEARQSGIRLICALGSGGDAVVCADQNQLKQVFINLLANSFQAVGGRGGEVTVRAEVVEEPTAEVRVTVEDDGDGIPPEVAQHMFDPFFSTRKSGVGLGLAICRKIVDAHGGAISGASRPGGGAVFEVRLPCNAHCLAGAPSGPAEARPREIR